MKAVVGVLVLLLNASHVVESFCDGREDGTQCYGPLRGTAVLQLMNSTSDVYMFQWIKKNKVILFWRQNRPLQNGMKSRSTFLLGNGTFGIHNLRRTDGGQYTLHISDSKGNNLETRSLHLTIEAPVSAVQLDSECLSQGERRASCFSEGGDSPEYSWTLDGQTVTNAQLQYGSSATRTITLKQTTSGFLVCSVSNHVSRVWRGECIDTCVVDSFCDGREDGTQCYGPLRGTAVLQLMNSTSDVYMFKWIKKNKVILFWRQNRPLQNWMKSRSTFFPGNGTFGIHNLRRTDGGQYTLHISDSKGHNLETRSLHLTIEAPVSAVQLDSECLSQGERRASCFSEGGDSPEYSWTLDGQTVTETQLHSGSSTNRTITLKQTTSGFLVCSVSNHVSRVWRGECIDTCAYLAVTTGSHSALVILIVVGVAFVCAHKKNNVTRGCSTSQRQLSICSGSNFTDRRCVCWDACKNVITCRRPTSHYCSTDNSIVFHDFR